MPPDPDPHGPLAKLVIAALLLGLCVALHAAGIVGLGRWAGNRHASSDRHYLTDLWTVVRITWVLIGLHLIAISIWAVAYVELECLPDLSTAFYFSSITYTTVGYGDVVLPAPWRAISGAEALTGILLAGLSTAYLFAFLSQLLQQRLRP
jgi:hypothetical protein